MVRQARLRDVVSGPRTPIQARSTKLHREAGQMAASDQRATPTTNPLRSMGRPQMTFTLPPTASEGRGRTDSRTRAGAGAGARMATINFINFTLPPPAGNRLFGMPVASLPEGDQAGSEGPAGGRTGCPGAGAGSANQTPGR